MFFFATKKVYFWWPCGKPFLCFLIIVYKNTKGLANTCGNWGTVFFEKTVCGTVCGLEPFT